MFATCGEQCTLDRDFVLHSKFGELYDTERFCFMHCEPSTKDSKPGHECVPLSEATVRRTYENTTSNRESLGHLDGAAGHVYAPWLGMACGEPGQSCESDNTVKIDGSQEQASNRFDVSGCVKTCESDVACGGFSFKPGADGSDDGKCVFRKNTRCNVAQNKAEDCYTKPTGMPIVNDLGNGIAPVTSGEVPSNGDGGVGYSCALFHPSEVCKDGFGLWCSVRREMRTCAKECSDRGLLCLGASSSLDGCPEKTAPAEALLALRDEPKVEVPDLGAVPDWYASLKKPYGSVSQYHLGTKEVESPRDLTDAPNWFVKEAQAGHLSGQYHLETAPVPPEVLNNASNDDAAETAAEDAGGMLTCESPNAASCTCGIMQ
jgi:hypothetical protein